MFSKARALAALIDLGMPAVFVDLFEGRPLPEDFDIVCGVPEPLYRASEAAQQALIPAGYEPLWDDGSFGAIYCHVAADGSLRKRYVEGGERRYASFQHFAAALLHFAWELEWDAVLPEYAEALGFGPLEALLAFFEARQGTVSSEQFDIELNRFVDGLAA